MPSDIGGGDGGGKAASRGEGELLRMLRTQEVAAIGLRDGIVWS